MKGYLNLILAVALFVPAVAGAQARRSQEFKDKYQLKEAVVLSRHNIRSPLSDSKSDLGRMTPSMKRRRQKKKTLKSRTKSLLENFKYTTKMMTACLCVRMKQIKYSKKYMKE